MRRYKARPQLRRFAAGAGRLCLRNVASKCLQLVCRCLFCLLRLNAPCDGHSEARWVAGGACSTSREKKTKIFSSWWRHTHTHTHAHTHTHKHKHKHISAVQRTSSQVALLFY